MFSELIQFSHLFCENLCPKNIHHTSEWKALACGSPLPVGENKDLFLITGLIHVFVVSGAHLIRLEKITLWIVKKFNTNGGLGIVFTALFFYTLACSFSAPIVRSFIALSLSTFFMRHQKKFSNSTLILISGLLALILESSWVQSFSFQMSWIMGLIVSVEFSRNSFLNKCYQSIWAWLFLWPTISLWNPPHPMTIVFNILLAPIVELILFPIALVSAAWWKLAPLFDYSLILLQKILVHGSIEKQIPLAGDKLEILRLNWLIILSLQAYFEFEKIKLRKLVVGRSG